MQSTRKIIFKWIGTFFLLMTIAFIFLLTGNPRIAKYLIYATTPIFLIAWIYCGLHVLKINKKAYINMIDGKSAFAESVFHVNEKDNPESLDSKKPKQGI
jgi:hypothetical protein